jgi:hypothetical protein
MERSQDLAARVVSIEQPESSPSPAKLHLAAASGITQYSWFLICSLFGVICPGQRIGAVFLIDEKP